ncbi:MAG: MoaD/ThiS family protein [Anaerolineaceae bacterium]|nr:MoaD/ThiS family protein [Anaerolineaceae bacterium]
MQINLYATFRMIAGVKSIEIDIAEGETVRAAVQMIITKYPVLRSHWTDDSGALYPHVHILVNGSDVDTLPDQIDTVLKPTDSLDFFPPVAGG